MIILVVIVTDRTLDQTRRCRVWSRVWSVFLS
jgi:hypothetical protein